MSLAGNAQRTIRRWIALAIFLSLLIAGSYLASAAKAVPSEHAESAVYETVIRNMVAKIEPTPKTRLLFDGRLIVGDFPGGDPKSCREEGAKWVKVIDDPPPFDTVADKTYRVLSGGSYTLSPRPEVIQDYLQRRCIGGQVSRSFHTDIPKVFLSEDEGPRGSLTAAFPGAVGVIGLSHAGFNSHLDEAVVSTSFVCGGLCGSGNRFYLRKIDGRWTVISMRNAWVS